MVDIPLLKTFPGSLHRFPTIMKIPKDEPTAKRGDPKNCLEIAALALLARSLAIQTRKVASTFRPGVWPLPALSCR
jgi:hypothetical protein